MTAKYVMAIDQGTTSTRVILYDHSGATVGLVRKSLNARFRQPGWVEQDAALIWENTATLMLEVLEQYQIDSADIISIGITNQRETTVLWDAETGQPLAPAIVWQSKQSTQIAERIKDSDVIDTIYAKTGLWVDSYFSATKIMWLMEEHPEWEPLFEQERVRFGTIDTWILWNLTEGREHATDMTNASRTMLFNIHTLKWDQQLLQLAKIPMSCLPVVKNSADDFGTTTLLGTPIPINALIGDQQAALFGHQAFQAGAIKSTYGTGAFIVMNTGHEPQTSKYGLLTTIAYSINNEVNYALEGSIFVAGAALQWLEEGMGILEDVTLSSQMAQNSSLAQPYQDIYLVPAFAGLGAPYWDQKIRGAAFGLTRMTNHMDLVRATLESLAYQTKDVLEAMYDDTGIERTQLVIDGGVAANDYLHQFLADLLQIEITRPVKLEMTARGAAYLAGLQSGFWQDQADLPKNVPTVTAAGRAYQSERMVKQYQNWQRAVESAHVFAYSES